MVASAACTAASLYHSTTIRHLYHTSTFSGPTWVCELLCGNERCIREVLGLGKQGFQCLVTALEQKAGLCDSHWGIATNEQVAIFLYVVTTGLALCRVTECFQ